MPNASRVLLDRRTAITPHGLPCLSEIIVASASGDELITPDGTRYLDLATGIGVSSIGHCHPKVTQAILQQVTSLVHACAHVATYEPYIALAEALAARVPHGDATKVLLVNSGAEAVENAIKIARQATGRSSVLCFTEAFHGRTLLGMTLTSKVNYKRGCGPFAPGVFRAPYPNAYLRRGGRDEDEFVTRALDELNDTFVHTVAADQLAAVIIEPIQGEGGIVPCPPRYLRGLREICDRFGVMLIADEVQAGLCRTGRWASYMHADVTPDLSTWAKALGGGLPVAAVVGAAEVMDAAAPGTVGSTFGGNPVACAAALATLEVMSDERLDERATEVGERIRDRLVPLAESSRWVGDVRGLGAMIGVEFSDGGNPRVPATVQAAKVIAACRARGVLLIGAGPYGNVIRLLPPLNIAWANLDRALDVLVEAIAGLES